MSLPYLREVFWNPDIGHNMNAKIHLDLLMYLEIEIHLEKTTTSGNRNIFENMITFGNTNRNKKYENVIKACADSVHKTLTLV